MGIEHVSIKHVHSNVAAVIATLDLHDDLCAAEDQTFLTTL